jgi:hypothetical protein
MIIWLASQYAGSAGCFRKISQGLLAKKRFPEQPALLACWRLNRHKLQENRSSSVCITVCELREGGIFFPPKPHTREAAQT